MVSWALRAGFRDAWLNWKMIIIYYFVNLICGLILLVPVAMALKAYVGDSLIDAELTGTFIQTFLAEFLASDANPMAMIFWLGSLIFLIYVSINVVLSGGAFQAFLKGQKMTARAFWGAAAHFAGRFLLLGFISMFFFGLVIALLSSLFDLLIGLVFGADPYEYITYWAGWVKIAIAAMGFMYGYMVLDIARIHMVAHEVRRASTALTVAWRFCLRNLRRTLTLAFALWLIGIMGLLIYNTLSGWLPASGGAVSILAMLLLQQLYILFKMMIRLALYAGEVRLYQLLPIRENKADILPAAASETPIVEAPPILAQPPEEVVITRKAAGDKNE